MVVKRDRCSDCNTLTNKLWTYATGKWTPIGKFCKKCGYLEIWGFPRELLHKERNIKE